MRATTKHWRWRSLALEASARWACAALLVVGLGALVVERWATQWRGSIGLLAVRQPDPSLGRSAALDGAAEFGWASLGLTMAFVMTALLSALMMRQVGARPAGASFARRVSVPVPVRMTLAVALMVLVLCACWGVVAGAARGGASGEQGLRALYSSWLPYTLALLAGAFALISLAEAWLARRAFARALEAFADAQGEGGT